MAMIVTQLYIVQLLLKFFVLSGSQLNVSLHDNGRPYINSIPSNTQDVKILKNDAAFHTESGCPKKLYFSISEAKKLGTCVFHKIAADTFFQPNVEYDNLSDQIRSCIRQITEKYSKIWCDEEIIDLSNNIANYLVINLPLGVELERRKKHLDFVKTNHLDERFRSKRELLSDDDKKENCETKLNNSFDCYRSELSRLSSALKSHQEIVLTPESRIIHQNNAGCDLIRNILNKCDQLLCNPTSQDSNVDTYTEYVRTILPNFEVQECGFQD
jgi:hypothetical protein